MQYNSNDRTLERNYQQKWKHLINEYELIKKESHTRFRFVGEFYKYHGISRQLFNKIYRRYASSGKEEDLLPQKRGPKWCSRRPDIKLEREVIEERKKGLNKYEICSIVNNRHQSKVTTPSGVYNIIKREGINVLREKDKEIRRKMIASKAGEIAHIDCHYCRSNIIEGEKKQYYLVCVVDGYSRIAWAEVVEDVKSLTVMFAIMRIFNVLKENYDIKFERVLTDNGKEFASPRRGQQHPFERMLIEIGVKHSYTRPYRPQTNGKVERFWRTIKDDLIETGEFKRLEEFQDSLFEYLIYYNELRPHQSLNGKTPLAWLQTLSTN